MPGRRGQEIKSLILTASAGPFRGKSREELRHVSREQALKHPNWRMGAKISIDSATMMNKGLEVLEAFHLYGVPAERIRVLVHPQSVVHSLVELADGSQLAQTGTADHAPGHCPLPALAALRTRGRCAAQPGDSRAALFS